MSATSKIDWLALADEWEKFVDYVDEKKVANDRYIRQEVEIALEEFTDRDDFADLEERIDRLVRAAGRRPSDGAKNKTLSADAIAEGEKTRVTMHIFADTREDFTILAKEQSDHSLGVVFSLALRERRQGGRAGRLEQKFDRVVDDAEALLQTTADSSGGVDLVERRTAAMVHALHDKYAVGEEPLTRHDIHRGIVAVVPTAETTAEVSDYLDETYREPILERIEYEASAENEKMYVPIEDAEEQRRKRADERMDAIMKGSPESVRTDGGSE